MDRQVGRPVLLVAGVVAGASAWLAALAVGWLLIAGPTIAATPEPIVELLLAAHLPPSSSVAGLDPLTWLGLPPATLYAVGPLAAASAGVVLGRLTRATEFRTGATAGATIALGYVPLLAASWVVMGSESALVVPVGLGIAVVCGAIGGIVGVRT